MTDFQARVVIENVMIRLAELDVFYLWSLNLEARPSEVASLTTEGIEYCFRERYFARDTYTLRLLLSENARFTYFYPITA